MTLGCTGKWYTSDLLHGTWPLWGPYIEMVSVSLSTSAFILTSTWKVHPHRGVHLRRRVELDASRDVPARWQLYLVTCIPFLTPFLKRVWYSVCKSVSASSNWWVSTFITSMGRVLLYLAMLDPKPSIESTFDTVWQPQLVMSAWHWVLLCLWIRLTLSLVMYLN